MALTDDQKDDLLEIIESPAFETVLTFVKEYGARQMIRLLAEVRTRNNGEVVASIMGKHDGVFEFLNDLYGHAGLKAPDFIKNRVVQ